jgi:hypothetical protein
MLTITYEGPDGPRTVEMPDQVFEALTSIAERNGLTLEEALAQAAVNEKLLEDEVDSGGKVLIEKGDQVRRLEYA